MASWLKTVIQGINRDQRQTADWMNNLDDWTFLIVLLGSINALTALVTIIVRSGFKGSITIAVASVLSMFAGIKGHRTYQVKYFKAIFCSKRNHHRKLA